MVVFASLFLGLVLGNQPIELVVEGDVATVRLALDGREVATLRGAPWKHEVDFGPNLRPHLLEAMALDAVGAALGGTRQWVNLPREAAEASLVLEGVDPARPDRARLIWQHIEYAKAESTAAFLDGAPLAVDPRGEIALPAYDPGQVHLLSAELRFDDGAHYRAELSSGGPGGSILDTELTGVAVRAAGSSPPTVDALAGRLQRDAEALRPVAVEKLPAKVVMVLEQGAIAPLRELAARGGSLVTNATGVKAGEEVRFLFPAVEMVPRRDVPARLFTMTQPFTRRDGSFAFLLTHVPAPPPQRYQRLTDAVAVAALQAAAGARPRAVVLVLGPQPKDESAYRVAEVLRYVEELRVPLLVWSTGRPSSRTVSEDRRPLVTTTPWGKADDIGSLSRILRAVEGLRATLDHQYTVWVEGSHLPNSIALAPGAKGFQLAGERDGTP